MCVRHLSALSLQRQLFRYRPQLITWPTSETVSPTPRCGPGSNGPFVVAVKLPETGDVAGLGQIVAALEKTEGVAKVVPSTEMLAGESAR